VSHVWHIQHRLFMEQLDAIDAEPTREQLMRLVNATRLLLILHQVNMDGYCRRCIRSRWWRLHRRVCTIYKAFAN
jgi:hypothetical protein